MPIYHRLQHNVAGAVSVSRDGAEVAVSMGKSLTMDDTHQVQHRQHTRLWISLCSTVVCLSPQPVCCWASPLSRSYEVVFNPFGWPDRIGDEYQQHKALILLPADGEPPQPLFDGAAGGWACHHWYGCAAAAGRRAPGA